MAKQVTVTEVDAFMRQLKWLIAGVVALFVIPLFVYAIYMSRRLDSFEDLMSQSPPQELEDEELGRGDLSRLAVDPVEGQVVYVPAYSHIYHSGGKPYLLTITLSVRNTSLEDAIVVESIRYFDTKGKEVKSYLTKSVRLPALGTTEIIVTRDDVSGGSGANFLVEWYANKPVTAPIVEAVMIGTNSQQGISFALRGSVISEVVPASSGDGAAEVERLR
ncbi:DUF3124 domain-containing protein [Aureliella helgolandensis]|uniref:DUF3124 domain-containing protein n=1 Tax=Aureliella helgolandensis TaxID=2527968 RepID=A0A518G3A2_9BACT|nr:DUF3124 domain-containing protein [Aureliella helgolandensis]QDV23064.1 hypothetical protein Q31a_13590 [Aureliella helgolandensis]